MPRKRLPQRPCPDHLEPEDRKRVRAWVEAKFAATRCPAWGVLRQPRRLREEWERHRDHHRALGNLGADWTASFRTWLDKGRGFLLRHEERSRLERESALYKQQVEETAARTPLLDNVVSIAGRDGRR